MDKVAKINEYLSDPRILRAWVETDEALDALDMLYEERKTDYMQNVTDCDYVNALDERAELECFSEGMLRNVSDAALMEQARVRSIRFVENFPTKENRETLALLLGLKPYATRDEILTKLNEVL
jgi:hypothetical protein